jgi:hypothetical protein
MLTDREYEPLIWTGGKFNYPGMVRIRTIADGSCLFHALLKAYYDPYKLGKINGLAFDRKKFVRELRRDLAYRLLKPVKVVDGKIYREYDLLAGGELAKFGQNVDEYSLDKMVKTLDSDSPVGNVYNEFISNILDKDIYLLDMKTKNVYITDYDTKYLYKDRPSIVILIVPGHYELVGINEGNFLRTLFSPDHPFIQAIRQRLNIPVKSS